MPSVNDTYPVIPGRQIMPGDPDYPNTTKTVQKTGSKNVTASTIIYSDPRTNAVQQVQVSAIQNIQFPDTSSIPSKPTITGEYRNQYVTTGPRRVVISIWFEYEQGGSFTPNDIATAISTFDYLKAHRIKFSLSTTHDDQDGRFLYDLVVENVSYERDAARRERVVCKINALQVRLIDLKWTKASMVDIFGQNILAIDPVTTRRMDFVVASVDKDFDFAHYGSFWDQVRNPLYYAYEAINDALNGAPVNVQIAEQIQDVSVTKDSLYFKLTNPIDMTQGTKTYKSKASFSSKYANSSSDKAYNVDIGELTIKVTQGNGVLVPNIPLIYVNGYYPDEINDTNPTVPKLTTDDLVTKVSTTPWTYDAADTYPLYSDSIGRSMDHMETISSFAKYYKEHPHSTEPKTRENNVIIDSTKVWTFQIMQRYSYDISYGTTFTKHLVPSGGLDVRTFEITTDKDGLKFTTGDINKQTDWDSLFSTGLSGVNYKIKIVTVTLGTLLQVFLFAEPFNNSHLNYNV